MQKLLYLTSLVSFITLSYGYPEPGKWHLIIDSNQTIVAVPKSLFKGSQIFIQVVCNSSANLNVDVSWSLTESMCWEDYLRLNEKAVPPDTFVSRNDNRTFSHYVSPIAHSCPGHFNPPIMNLSASLKPGPESHTLPADSSGKIAHEDSHIKEREDLPVVIIPKDGFYLVIVMISSQQRTDFKAEVLIDMKGPHGYLSASDWPLMLFYGTMCLVYIFLGVLWLILSFCRWQDLLRIQFWIGGVIFLGMLEKAMFYGEYSNINKTGEVNISLVLTAEWVSCAKRTLARMLVIIVNLGFGIVKPRLGPMLPRVLGVGGCYFLLAAIESYLRVLPSSGDSSNALLLASIPLAALDSIICWWILTALVQTTRTLRLRRNTVKLNLYRHFTNTLIFNLLASAIFMVYVIKTHRLPSCLTDWKGLWVEDAFWHVLFSIILIVIMILWRPTNNNQRYAFSPLLDNPEDDEDEDQFVNDAYGVKMRSHSRAGSPKLRQSSNNEDEDILKWVDDNIPSAGVEAALPILDSDEEVLTTRFEVSKML